MYVCFYISKKIVTFFGGGGGGGEEQKYGMATKVIRSDDAM